MFSTPTKVFFINEVFTFQRGKRLIKEDQLPGKIPYISSTMLNNGVDNFISPNSINRSTKKKPRIFRNALTIANSGSVGSVFYHPYEFIASDHVTVLKLIDRELDFHLAMFLKVILNQKASNYSFNREISNERMSVEKVTLPALSNGKIDWGYIYNFVEKDLALNELEKEFTKYTFPGRPKQQLDVSAWEWWSIDELFSLKRGKGIIKQERESGSIPYISAKNNNNGLEEYVSTKGSLYRNVLGWVNDGDGGVGYCFYHPYEFKPSNHITVLIPKWFVLNDLTGLFFSTIITLENEKHSRGFSINNYRANRTKIKLPTTIKDGKRYVDFDSIEHIMSELVPIES